MQEAATRLSQYNYEYAYDAGTLTQGGECFGPSHVSKDISNPAQACIVSCVD